MHQQEVGTNSYFLSLACFAGMEMLLTNQNKILSTCSYHQQVEYKHRLGHRRAQRRHGAVRLWNFHTD